MTEPARALAAAAPRSTRWWRVALGLVAGAALGGLFEAGEYGVGTLRIRGLDYFLLYRPRNVSGIFLIASVVWLSGILALGGPAWIVLHRTRRTSWLAAAVVGAVLPAFVAFAMGSYGFGLLLQLSSGTFSAGDSGGPLVVNNVLTAHGWRRAALGALAYAVKGAVVGLLIWRIAYVREVTLRM